MYPSVVETLVAINWILNDSKKGEVQSTGMHTNNGVDQTLIYSLTYIGSADLCLHH